MARTQLAIRACALVIFCLLATACSSGNGEPTSRSLKTWEQIRWQNIVKQNYDYSCGTAALATLGKRYFEDPLSEPLVLKMLLDNLHPMELEDRVINGFSMLDLQRIARQLGYKAVGVKLPPEAIFQLKGPIIVILRDKELEHFVVLKGADQRRVYLADSSRGNIRMPLFAFYKKWNGTALVLGRDGFGLPDDYLLAVKDRDKCCPEVSAIRQMKPAFKPIFVR